MEKQLISTEKNESTSVVKKGNCGRCGRPLKSKTSIDRGYGPSCYKKVQAEKAKKEEDKKKEDIEEEVETVCTDYSSIKSLERGYSTGITIVQDFGKIIKETSRLKPLEIRSNSKYLRDIKSGKVYKDNSFLLSSNSIIIGNKEYPFKNFELIKGRDLISEAHAVRHIEGA